MDQDQEQRHVCKVCNKSFLNGKVLGGHMRCHVARNSVKSEKKLSKSNAGIEECGERVAYGLRVNPKKSCKVSNSNQETSGQEVLCKVCGKGFDSLRALFGHMRHHSGRRRKEVCCKECGKEFESLRALTGHMKSHSEKLIRVSIESSEKLFGDSQYSGGTSGLIRKKRSTRLRYKMTPNSSVSNLSESSFGAGFDHEVEEVAICLLMLSRGVRNSDGFGSLTESSDNNSSAFEVKSFNQCKRILDNDGGNDPWNGDGSLKMKKPRLEEPELCVLDSNNFFNEKKISEFSENNSGFGSDEEKIMKLDGGSAISVAGINIEKERYVGMRINSVETESDENPGEEVGMDLAAGFGSLKSCLSEKTRFDCPISGSETLDNSHKKSEYKCRTCNKIFHSHQALGGHQTIHRSTKACPTLQIDDHQVVTHLEDFPGIEATKNGKSSKLEYNESSMELEMDRVTMTSNETKEHKCPICFKIFGSGQALGGHKRAHVVKDSEAGVEQISLLRQDGCNICDVLDAPMALGEEVNSTEVELKSWWVKNDHKHELLVGLNV